MGLGASGCRTITSRTNWASAAHTSVRVWPGSGCGLKMTKYTVRLSVDLGSCGTVNMMTLPAMTVDELRKKLKELGKKPSR